MVLVGITPGPMQLELSYEEAGKSGASDETVLREAKRVAGFGGSSMRPNLVRMLNHFDFAGADPRQHEPAASDLCGVD